jgi:hypothetical protein
VKRVLIVSFLAPLCGAFLLFLAPLAHATPCVPTLPGQWEYPGGPGYAATSGDNGQVISSAQTSASPPNAGLQVTLPLPSTISACYTIGLFGTPTQPLTVGVQNTGGAGVIQLTGVPTSQTSWPVPANSFVVLQYQPAATGVPAQFVQLSGPLPSVLHYPSRASVAALNFPASTTIYLDGYYYAGDGTPQQAYQQVIAACSLNGGAGDGGSQIEDANGCLIPVLGQSGEISVKQWGATGSSLGATSLTCSTTASSGVVHLSSVAALAVGETIDCIGAGSSSGVGTPATPTLTVVGPTGSSTYCMRIAYIGVDNQIGPASAEVATFVGNSVLDNVPDLKSAAQGLNIAWSAPSSSVKSIVVYEGPCGGETFVGVADPAAGSWNYYGVNGQNREPWVPAAYLATAQNQFLSCPIASINTSAGTVTCGNSVTAGASVSGEPAWIDDTAAIVAAHASGFQHLVGGPGTYVVTAGITNSAQGQTFTGCGIGCTVLMPETAGWNLYTTSGADVTETGTASSSLGGQGMSNLTVLAAGMASGFVLDDGSTEAVFENIQADQPFALAYVGSAVGSVLNSKFWRIDETDLSQSYDANRGDYGWVFQQQGSVGIVNANEMHFVVVGRCSNCGPNPTDPVPGLGHGYSELIQGGIDSIKAQTVDFQSAPDELEIDDANGSISAPKLNKFTDQAYNFCWYFCANLQSAGAVGPTSISGTTFNDNYFQATKGGGSSAIYLGAYSTSNVFNGGLILGAYTLDGTYGEGADLAGIDDSAFGTVVNGMRIFATSGEAIKCEAGATTQINGGEDYRIVGENNYSAANYGVVLEPGCGPAQVSGAWIGQLGDVVDQTGHPNSDVIYDRPKGSVDTEVGVVNGMSLSIVAPALGTCTATGGGGTINTCRGLYNQPAQSVGYLSPTGNGTPVVHLDTAANIAAAMPGNNTLMWLKNEANPAGLQTITLAIANGDSSNISLSGPGGVTNQAQIAPGYGILCSIAKGTPMVVACSQ